MKFISNLQAGIRIWYQFNCFRKISQGTNIRFELEWKDRYPCIEENNRAIKFDRHYVYHLAWAARKLKEINPKKHIDISSHLYFPSLVSAFIPIDYYEYRPPHIEIENLTINKGDLLNLPFQSNSILSLSSMHTIEHIGLGRYGDSLDYDGDIKAINELQRVITKHGYLLFVVPIGKPRILFNAHRIYSYQQVVDLFPKLKLIEFALIPDNPNIGGLIKNASKEIADSQNYGCGCFLFRRY